MTLHRLLTLSLTGAATAAAVLIGAPPASAAVPDSYTFADPFQGDFSCDGFDAHFEGHDRGLVTTYFDAEGTPVREIGHIHSTETDTNLATGDSITVRTNLTVHAELDPDGNYVTWALTGELDIANRPGEGIVLHDSGRVELAQGATPQDAVVTALKGVHDTFTSETDPFCTALG